MAFLESFRKAAPPVERKEARSVRTSYSATLPTANIWRTSWSTSGSVDKALLATTWVFRAVTAIAANQAKLPMVVRHNDRFKGPAIEDHPLLTLLNDVPNSYERAVQFRFRLSLQLLLNKAGAFVEVERGPDNEPIALHLGDPDRFAPVRDPQNYVSGYELRGASGTTEVIPPENIIWIRAYPHPSDLWSGMSPLEPLGISIDIDRFARVFQKNYLANDGKLGGIVSINGAIDDEVADEIMAHLTTGPAAAGRWMPVEADGIEMIDFGSNPRDAQYVQQRQQTKSEIYEGFGVPESVAGNASARTYANAEAELLGFWRETMQSHCTFLAAPFDGLTRPGEFVGFDYSEIAVLQRDLRNYETHLLSLWESGLITIDEFRTETGREPVGTAGTETFYIPANKYPAGQNPSDQSQPGPQAPATPVSTAAVTPSQPSAMGENDDSSSSADLADAVNG
jgi:HK97 family phage portal protein